MANIFEVLNTDGYSVDQLCQDPIATNYQISNPCTYPASPKTGGLTTTTPITFFASQFKPQPNNMFLFLNWAGPDTSIAAGGILPVKGTPVSEKYLFYLTKNNCQFRNTPGSNIYFGDYVQIAIKNGSVNNYFNPGGGKNLFTALPGDCSANSWQTFQILDANKTVNDNKQVTLNDTIILVNLNFKATLIIGKNGASAGLGAQGTQQPINQRASKESFRDRHPLTKEAFGMYFGETFLGSSNKKERFNIKTQNIIFYISIIILFLIIIALIYFVIKKKK